MLGRSALSPGPSPLPAEASPRPSGASPRPVGASPRPVGASAWSTPGLRWAVLALALALVGGCGPSGDPDLRVEGDVRAAVPVAGSSQVVVTIVNDGDGDDELVEATTESALGVEIHLTEVVEGRASMTEQETVDLPAGEQVRFAPGGLHLMLVVPDETVVDGGTFDLTLHFDRSEALTVTAEVVPLADLAEDALTDDLDEELLDPDLPDPDAAGSPAAPDAPDDA